MSKDQGKDIARVLEAFNGIEEGRTVADPAAGAKKRMQDNDMTAILSNFVSASGEEAAPVITEDSAKQLPAEFEPETISPVVGEPEKEHPASDYFVGETEDAEESDYNQDENSIKERLQKSLSELKQQDSVEESVTQEDQLSGFKKQLGDYLQDLGTEIAAKDDDLKPKSNKDSDLGPTIKTITTSDGKKITIHGNEDDGFRLRVNERVHSARFSSYDDAAIACEMYMARKKQSDSANNDYVDENQ